MTHCLLANVGACIHRPGMLLSRRHLASACLTSLALLGCSSPGAEPILLQMEVTTATPSMVGTVGGSAGNLLVVTRTNRARGPVRMEATGLPAGATVSFAPNPLPPSDAASTTMSIRLPSTVRPGAYEVRVRAIGDGIADGVRILPLTVRAAP